MWAGLVKGELKGVEVKRTKKMGEVRERDESLLLNDKIHKIKRALV
jgi:hypothetical protein